MSAVKLTTRGAWLVRFMCLALLVSAVQAFATEPAAPGSLRAEVYSRSAAELFWDRSAAAGLVYEVRRDGASLTVTDGVSHFDDTLAAGTVYGYEVIAIDPDGQRSPPSTVTLETPGGAMRPQAPTGLRSEVYSRTAAELFWDRPDADGLAYEVSRDGTPQAVTTGVSHFDDALVQGRTYEYGVRAIDTDGRRSEAATVRLTTPGTAGDDGTDEPGELVAPDIERIEIYSGTAAELFWQRPPPGSPVARVEVVRDTLVLGTTDGTSFFDDARSPGVEYAYTLVAIAADGRRSDDGAPDPGAGGDGRGAIRADNVVALLAEAFDAYRGEPWGNIVYALPGFSRTPSIRPNEERTLTCDNGGTVTIRGINTGFGGGPGFVFDDCLDGEILFDGQVDTYSDRYGIQNVRGTGFSVAGPTGTIRYSGHVRELSTAENFFTVEPVEFERDSADGSRYSLVGAELDFQYGPTPGAPYPTVRLGGSFTLASDRTGEVRLSVQTPESLGRPIPIDPVTGPAPLPDDWTFTEGSLRVTAPDASTVLLEADNGDEASARLTLTDSAGEGSSFDEPWSTWQRNLRLDLSTGLE